MSRVPRELEALLAEYRTNLPRQLARLDELLAAGRIYELQRALHTLAGSAGTFGLPQIGEAARAAGACLAANPGTPQREEFMNLFSRLKELGTALASPG